MTSLNETVELRRLTPSGITRFKKLLAQLATEPELDIEQEMSSPIYYEKVRSGKVFPAANFVTKKDYGRWLTGQLSEMENVTSDVGLWSWIALKHFDSIRFSNKQGTKASRTANRYVLDTPRSSYRHLAWQCWWAIKNFDTAGEFLLDGNDKWKHPLSYQGGEVMAQLGANQKTAGSVPMVDFGRRVFTSPTTGKRSKMLSGSGRISPRDFVRVSKQLYLTYDLASMSVEKLTNLYPERYRSLAANH